MQTIGDEITAVLRWSQELYGWHDW